MRKFFTFSLILVFGVAVAQPTYYNHATTTGGANVFPFNVNPATGKKVQWVIAAGEFNQPSPAPPGNNITTLWFWANNAGNATYTNLTIRMATVSTSTFISTGAFYTGPMTTVRSQTTTIAPAAANSWVSIPLTIPFPYDPTMNLIIEVSQCGYTGTGFSLRQLPYGAAPNYRRQYSDAASPCGSVPLPTGGDLNVAGIGITAAPSGPVLTSSGSSFVTEGCAPANGAIDPVETVTVSLCLQNIGNVNTTNLIGTLQSSGGVVSPSGPQTYGVVVAGGPSVCRNFTFSNTGICGGTITASLQLQDGATNLGTITYTFNLGVTTTTTVFTQNFNSGAPGWTTQNLSVNVLPGTDWALQPDGYVYGGNTFHSNDNSQFYMTNSDVGGSGQTYTLTLLQSPSFSTVGYSTLNLSYYDYYLFWNTQDTVQVQASTNGTTWTTVKQYAQATVGGPTAFVQENVNLNAYVGNPTVYIRFRYRAVWGFWWALDNVNVTASNLNCCGVPPPCTLTCPANITVNNTPGQCGATVSFPAVTASGSCGNITTSSASGSFFPVGNTTVTATSQSGATCNFIIRVVDAQAPTITCIANATKSANNNVCTYTAVGTEFDAPASDNCPGVTKAYSLAGVTSGSGTTLAGKVFNKGVTTVTWTATDAASNTSSCSFTVTVNDTQNPSITCPGNSTKTTAVNVCTYTAVGTEFDATSSDNCPGVTQAYTLTGATTGTGALLAGKAFNTGVTTVTWKATDASGNTTACSFTVTINDGSLPIVTQPSNKTVCEGNNATFTVVGTTGATLTYQWQQWNGSAWVNIAGATSSSYTVTSATIAMNTNSFRAIITTICGNSITSAFASLYVNKLPVITLSTSRSSALIPGQFVTLTANANPTGGIVVWRKNGNVITGYDAFSIPNLTVDDIGTYTVTYTDQNGCSQTSAAVSITAQSYDKLFVYPNPNNGQFQIRFYNQAGQAVSINIFDERGAKVYHRSLVTGQLSYSRIDVDLSKLNSGVYTAELLDASGNKIGAKRFIIGH